VADGNSVASVVELKPPVRERSTGRQRNRSRKKQVSAKADVTPQNPPNVMPLTTQSVTPGSLGLQIFGGSRTVDRASRLGAMLLFMALVVSALAVGINAQTGWRFGTTLMSAATFAGLSMIADMLAITLPTVAVALWLRSRWALASAAWATWTVSLALALLASIGFINGHVSDATAARQAILNTAAELTAQREAAITTAQRAVATAAESREAECKVRGQRCRALEQEEQLRLTELSAVQALPLPAAPSMADADPQLAGVLRLANWAGLRATAGDLGNLRLALMALLPNLAGLLLCFGVALRLGLPLVTPVGTPPLANAAAPH
jgi:hypothetical protein